MWVRHRCYLSCLGWNKDGSTYQSHFCCVAISLQQRLPTVTSVWYKDDDGEHWDRPTGCYVCNFVEIGYIPSKARGNLAAQVRSLSLEHVVIPKSPISRDLHTYEGINTFCLEKGLELRKQRYEARFLHAKCCTHHTSRTNNRFIR